MDMVSTINFPLTTAFTSSPYLIGHLNFNLIQNNVQYFLETPLTCVLFNSVCLVTKYWGISSSISVIDF